MLLCVSPALLAESVDDANSIVDSRTAEAPIAGSEPLRSGRPVDIAEQHLESSANQMLQRAVLAGT